MKDHPKGPIDSTAEVWAMFRFRIIAGLLAAPPPRGELRLSLRALAEREWQHPLSAKPLRFSWKTLESWYYAAIHGGDDPIAKLRRTPRSDRLRQPSISEESAKRIRGIWTAHSDWTMQLISDELAAQIKKYQPGERVPSYPSVCRFLKKHGLYRRRKRKTGGGMSELVPKEQRAFEVDRVNALWHLDFHQGSRKVLMPDGHWWTAHAMGILDDHSRLAVHLQWYLSQDTEDLVHAFGQGLMKCGIPRALMSDNGAAMTSTEFTRGLERLGILHQRTLPYHPAQNGKQERFWKTMEGRLMALLSSRKDLDLPFLNKATQAWVEKDYNLRLQSEIGMTPREAYLSHRDAGREPPTSRMLRQSFTRDEMRSVRRSTGTITISRVIFEIPSVYRHLERVRVRYQIWDLTRAWLVDPHDDLVLCRLYPEDRAENADGIRAVTKTTAEMQSDALASSAKEELPEMMKRLMKDYETDTPYPGYLSSPKRRKEEQR